MKAIEYYIDRFSQKDQEKLAGLNRRYHTTKDKRKREEISREYQLEKRKIDVYDFWKNHQGNVVHFLNTFDQYIHTAATFMEQNNPKEAIRPVRQSIEIFDKLYKVLKKLKSHEKYILKLSKKEQRVEEKERVGR
jgi:hypothetical protein